MKRYFIFMAIILGMIAPSVSAQTAAKKKVAVYMTGNDVQDSYKKVIGAKLVSAITATNEYAAVERTADFLAALSSEHDFQTSGEVQDSQIARLGQKFGVRYVVVADVGEVFEELFVSARLINVESALVEKAFDANAPAENMAQLIDLSTKVAKGLLGAGGFAQGECGISTEPTNMSLCAVKDGKIVFISPSQWQLMKETERITFNKKGVCLIDNGELSIVGMRNTNFQCDVYAARENNAPTMAQWRIILQNINEVNTALRHFGGEPIKTGRMPDGLPIWYWTSEVASDAVNYIFDTNLLRKIFIQDPSFNIFNRPVYTLNGINYR